MTYIQSTAFRHFPGSTARLAPGDAFPYSEGVEVRFKPDLQAKLDELATETGRPTDELVEDVVAGYFDELARTQETLNSRYDDLKSGRVKPIDGEEAFARLKANTEAQRNRQI